MFCSIRQISQIENAFGNEADVNQNVNGFLESLAKLDSVSRKCHDGYGSESNSLLPAAARLSVVEEAGSGRPWAVQWSLAYCSGFVHGNIPERESGC